MSREGDFNLIGPLYFPSIDGVLQLIENMSARQMIIIQWESLIIIHFGYQAFAFINENYFFPYGSQGARRNFDRRRYLSLVNYRDFSCWSCCYLASASVVVLIILLWQTS